MPGSNDIRAGGAVVEIRSDDRPLDDGLKAAAAKLQAWGAVVRNVGIGLSAGAAAVTAPLTALALRAADWGQALLRASQRTGVTTEALSELKYGAEQTGADFETLETGLRKMGQFMVKAAQGSAEANDALDRLGISVEDLGKLSPDKRLGAMADSLAKIRDPSERAAVAMEVFGKTGTQLLPLLKEGAAGLERWRQRARELGLTESTESTVAAAGFKLALNDLWAVLNQLGQTVANAVIPILKEKAERITSIIVQVMRWAEGNRDLIATVFRVATGVGAVGAALITFGTALTVAGKAVGLIGPALSAVGSAAGVLLSPMGLTVAAVAALAGYLLYASGVAGPVFAVLGEGFRRVGEDAKFAFGGISDALSAGRWGLAAEIAMTAVRMAVQRGVVAVADVWATAAGPIAGAWGDLLGRVVQLTQPVMSWLGVTWQQVGDGLRLGLGVALDYLVGAFSAAEVAVENFRDVARLAAAAVELAFTRVWENVKFFATEVVPSALKWLASEGPKWFKTMLGEMLAAIANFAGQVWSFVKANVPLLVDYVWASLKGDGNKQSAIQSAIGTALQAATAGANAVANAPPPGSLARQKTARETQLEAELAAGSTAFAAKYEEAYQRNKAAADRAVGNLGGLGGSIGTALASAKSAADAELKRLQRELEDLRAQAGKSAVRPPGADVPGGADDYGLSGIGGKAKPAGTFSAVAASLLGAQGGYAERTAKATEKLPPLLGGIKAAVENLTGYKFT